MKKYKMMKVIMALTWQNCNGSKKNLLNQKRLIRLLVS